MAPTRVLLGKADSSNLIEYTEASALSRDQHDRCASKNNSDNRGNLQNTKVRTISPSSHEARPTLRTLQRHGQETSLQEEPGTTQQQPIHPHPLQTWKYDLRKRNLRRSSRQHHAALRRPEVERHVTVAKRGPPLLSGTPPRPQCSELLSAKHWPLLIDAGPDDDCEPEKSERLLLRIRVPHMQDIHCWRSSQHSDVPEVPRTSEHISKWRHASRHGKHVDHMHLATSTLEHQAATKHPSGNHVVLPGATRTELSTPTGRATNLTPECTHGVWTAFLTLDSNIGFTDKKHGKPLNWLPRPAVLPLALHQQCGCFCEHDDKLIATSATHAAHMGKGALRITEAQALSPFRCRQEPVPATHAPLA